MDRKDFLVLTWKRFFQPIVTLSVIYFCVQFFIAIFNEDGTARAISKFVLGLTIVLLILHLLGQLFSQWIKNQYAQLSERSKTIWRIIGKIIETISLLLLSYLFIECWMKDAFVAAIVSGLLLFQFGMKLLKSNKVES
jgi:hydrogenase/urease accessory protein HupE